MTELFSRNYIGGNFEEPEINDRFYSVNPASGTIIGSAVPGSLSSAERAVASARNAFENSEWQNSPRLRANSLLVFADNLEKIRDDLAPLLVQENGKILEQCRHEINAGVSEARYYAGLARNIFGRTTETSPNILSLLTKEPVGVVSVIVPWNAPVTLLVRSVAPALCAGCTVVIKPAIQTPLVNSRLMECFHAIKEMPAGVVNSINENGIEIGELLSSHEELDMVSFTGSVNTGKMVMANCAKTLKKVSLELGGKTPAIVFDDADLDRALGEISRAVITISGQMCTAVNRILIHHKIFDQFAERLQGSLSSVVIGNGLDSTVEMGPVIDKTNQLRLLDLVKVAKAETDVLLEGKVPEHLPEEGSFISPTLFVSDNTDHKLVQEELFGPMASLEIFQTEEEALIKANATIYGLAASVYTNDLNRAMRFSRKLQFGTVWLNCHNRLFAEAETGGYKQSGIGRLHGVEALSDFMETKHIYLETN